MSSHHRHPTFMPCTKTCFLSSEFFCFSQSSAANTYIIHPANNNTLHLHISASAEAAQSHYNQTIRGTLSPQGSNYVNISESKYCTVCLLACFSIRGSAAHHEGIACWLPDSSPYWVHPTASLDVKTVNYGSYFRKAVDFQTNSFRITGLSEFLSSGM
jgi:hypothetical protein